MSFNPPPDRNNAPSNHPNSSEPKSIPRSAPSAYTSFGQGSQLSTSSPAASNLNILQGPGPVSNIGLFSASTPRSSGHSRSVSHGGNFLQAGGAPSTTAVGRSALKGSRGHQRALSQGQISEGGAIPSAGTSAINGTVKPGHSRVSSKTDFILPPGYKDAEAVGDGAVARINLKGHSRQASRSESIYTLRRSAPPPIWQRLLYYLGRTPKYDIEERYRVIVPNHTVPGDLKTKDHPNARYRNNHIRTTKYTLLSFLPRNLLEQFHRVANLYFIFIVLLNWFPAINAFGKEIAMLPVVFVLGVTAVKDFYEDRRRHASDKRINNSTCRIYNSECGRYRKVLWKDVRVGDLIHLSNNEVVPADILVLRSSDASGLCYIDTGHLDGETNLKQRQVARGFIDTQRDFEPRKVKSKIEVEAPTTKIYRFHGAIVHPEGGRVPVGTDNLLLRESLLKNTDFVEGIVVYAGHETKALLNNGGPRYKRSSLEKQMNRDVMWCVVILGLLCFIGAMGTKLWLNLYSRVEEPFRETSVSINTETFLSFWIFIIVLQIMIPLSLYVTLELCKILQVYHIHNNVDLYDPTVDKRTECRALNITEELGQVQYVFSDKTGTLTENRMIFRNVTIAGVEYNHPELANEGKNGKLTNLSVLPNPMLLSDLYQEGILSEHVFSSRSVHSARIQEFLLLLALCNTVVCSNHPHHDIMNASGIIENVPNLTACEENEDNTIQTVSTSGTSSLKSNDKYARLDESRSVTPSPPLSSFQVEARRSGHIPTLTPIESSDTSPMDSLQSQGEAKNQNAPAPHHIGKNSFYLMLEMTKRIFDANLNDGAVWFKPYIFSEILRLTKGATHLVWIGSSKSNRPRLLNIPTIGFLMRKNGSNTNLTDEQKVKLNQSSPTPSPIEMKPIYEAESPDELALVDAAYLYTCRLLKRTPIEVIIDIPIQGKHTFSILNVLPFDSTRKRMSIIVKHPVTGEIILYCKGADSTMFPYLSPAEDDSEQKKIIDKTQQQLGAYAREGLRVLVMAKRILSQQEYTEWLRKHQEAEVAQENLEKRLRESYYSIECKMTLLGATGIEDRLQEGVPETLSALISAGIVVWVLTGDKPETAINIAYSARLFSPQMELLKLMARSKEMAQDTINCYLNDIERSSGELTRTQERLNDSVASSSKLIGGKGRNLRSSSGSRTTGRALVVDGKTLTYILDRRSNLTKPFLELTKYCNSVLCCRATPLQKAYIVKVVKEELKMRTLAIGDGANDVSMIQTADVGIGISGQEGMQAVMAADFALSRFKYLEQFLLVHGHWCYDRLSRMVLYFFYKNATFVFLMFWYQFYCGFSGAVMIDQMYLMMYNLLFTSLSPIVIGVYDQDAPATLLIEKPYLYKVGRLGQVYRPFSFWLTMIDSVYQSLAVYFICLGAYNGSDVDVYEFGAAATTACMFVMLCHATVETRAWSIIHLASIILSIGAFYVYSYIYDSFCVNCFGLPSTYYTIQMAVQRREYWLSTLLSMAVAILPRLIYRVIETVWFPSEVTQALISDKRARRRRGEKFLVSWSRSTSTSSVCRATGHRVKNTTLASVA